MSKISLQYNGSLRCNLVHNSSQIKIITDAPKDNNGKGKSFSPTDLVASALAACMVTVIGIQNEKRNFGITSMNAEVEKIMTGDPRKISKVVIDLEILLKKSISAKMKEEIKLIAHNCPVALSLSESLTQSIKISFTH